MPTHETSHFPRCFPCHANITPLALAVVCVSLCMGLAAPAAHAQPNLDNTELIETLSRRGMTALLDRLVETDPPKDIADRRLLEIARVRLALRQLELGRSAAIQQGDAAQALDLNADIEDAFNALVEAQRQLANDPALQDRWERAIWKTDLAEVLLFEQLQGRGNHAAEFLEFGVPTAAQEQAVAAAAVEALSLTTQAQAILFEAQRFYGGNDHARQRDQANQLYYRLLEDYGEQRTPLYAATAMHLVSLLPDDAAYFTDPDSVGASDIPGRKAKPADEKRRLQRDAVDHLETLLASDPGSAEDAVRSRLGRVLVARGQAPAGLDEQLDPVTKSGAVGLAGLTAGLGKAAALRQLKRYNPALESLDQLNRNELVETNPLLRLLLTDMRFLTFQARAKNDAARTAAYDVYFDMLRDKEVRASAPALRSMIYQRWTDALEVGQDASSLSPAVRMAVGQTAREAGQRAKFVEGDAAEAKRQLQWSVQINDTLTGEDLPDAVRASGLFNRALAQVLLNGEDVATLIQAVGSWTEVADRYPREPMAQEAITYAADYATALVQQAPTHPAVKPLYEKTMDVLFSRYDETDTAGKHRLFFAYNVFQQQGLHDRAAREYARVPFGHDQYFEAQTLRVFNLQRAYELTADDATDPESGEKLRAIKRDITTHAAEQLLAEAQAAAEQTADPEANRAVGAALLGLAVASLDAGNPDAALQHLDRLETRFAGKPDYEDVYRDAVSRRIVTLVSAGRYNDASTVAQKMMSRFPDAAAGVIGDVLRDLETRITTLRRDAAGLPAPKAKPLQEQAATLAAVTSTLANLLVSWADDQNLGPADMLSYELPYIRSLRIAGRPADAWQFMKDRDMLAQFAEHLDVLEAAGETLYALGVEEKPRTGGTDYAVRDAKLAREAIPHFDRIITGLTPPFPDTYWNAWLRRLSLNVALGLDADKVPLRIRQLEAAHPDLGGPAFADRFKRLAVDARNAH